MYLKSDNLASITVDNNVFYQMSLVMFNTQTHVQVATYTVDTNMN